MALLTETIHAGAFIVQEGPGYYSRDQVTVALSQTLLAGAPVYDDVVAAGATSSAAIDASNTGNGVLTLDVTTPILAGAQTGTYRLICIEPGANVGTFAVFDPSGVEIGRHVVAGAAFANQIKFAIADGATDFVAGDGFSVIVGLESGIDQQVKALPNDGTQVCSGLMVYPITTGASVTLKGARISRLAEVRLSDIQWPAGISAVNKAKAVEELRARGIVGRV